MSRSSFRGFGVALRRASRYGTIRTVALAIASAMFVLGCAALVVTEATYSGWDQREAGRGNRPASELPDEALQFYGAHGYGMDTDSSAFDIIYLQAVTASPPPPPGLSNWPAPGDVYASRALLESGAIPPISKAGAFGVTRGEIGSAGLVEDHERYAYVGVSNSLSDANATLSTGWGKRDSTEWFVGFPGTLTVSMRDPVRTFETLVAVLWVFPAAWFAVSAIRVGATNRARRYRIIRTLGGRTRHLTALGIGEATRGLVTGWAAAVVAAAASLVVDIPLPGLPFVVRAVDIRSHVVAYALVIVGAMLLTAIAAVTPWGLRKEERSVDRTSKLSAWTRVALLPALAVAYVTAMNLASASSNFALPVIVFFVCIAGIIPLVPVSTRAFLEVSAKHWRVRAWHRGDAGGLVGSAQLGAAPGPATRFSATAIILIMLLGFAFSYVDAIDNDRRQMTLAASETGVDVAFIEATPVSDSQKWHDALVALDPQYAMIAISRPDPFSPNMMFTGPAESLDAFGIVDGEHVPQWYAGSEYPGSASRNVSPVTPTEDGVVTNLAVRLRDGKDIDVSDLRDVLAKTTVPAWRAYLPGEDWLSGANLNVEKSQWIAWLGTITMLLGLGSLWTSYTNELLRSRRGIVPLQIISPSSRFVGEALFWRIVTPVAMAGVAGSILTFTIVWPLMISSTYVPPNGFVIGCMFMAIGTGLVAWSVTWLSAVRSARHFKLTVPEE